ncbi:MAG: cryptochrome/photolyase family protein, partial [Bacteriovoracaceae bacterium]
MKLQIVLGSQLFPIKYYKKTPNLVFMCEDINLCTHYKYHKHKIIFFLTSMRKFRKELETFDHDVHYYQIEQKPQFFQKLKKLCLQKKVQTISVYEIEDKFFESLVEEFCLKNNIKLEVLASPMFLVKRNVFKKYNQKTKKPFMKSFYEGVRNATGILMESEKNPTGGKYSFDTDNRKKIPKKFDVIQSDITLKQDKEIDSVGDDHIGSNTE